MSRSSLFNEKTEKSFDKFTVFFMILLVVVLGSAYGFYRYATYEPEITAEQIAGAKTRDSVAMLLAQPGFSGESFREQILGKVRLQRYMLDKKELYFSAPQSSEQEFAAAVGRFVIDQQKLVFAEDEGAKFKLDRLSLRKTPETGYFFKTKLENLRFDPNSEFEFPYQDLTFNLSEACA